MLHESVENRVWVRLELAHHESVAADVLPQPLLFQVHHALDLGLVSDHLTIALEVVGDIVPEKVIGDDKGFLTLEALLSCVVNAVGIVVVLAWRSAQDSVCLQL